MVEELKKIKEMVWDELVEHPETRNSDKLLVRNIYNRYGVGRLPFEEVIVMEGLPSTESIRRCRQKIQEENISLRGKKQIEKMRMEMQVEYIQFAQDES